jgi:hypothetical protein
MTMTWTWGTILNSAWCNATTPKPIREGQELGYAIPDTLRLQSGHKYGELDSVTDSESSGGSSPRRFGHQVACGQESPRDLGHPPLQRLDGPDPGTKYDVVL